MHICCYVQSAFWYCKNMFVSLQMYFVRRKRENRMAVNPDHGHQAAGKRVNIQEERRGKEQEKPCISRHAGF